MVDDLVCMLTNAPARRKTSSSSVITPPIHGPERVSRTIVASSPLLAPRFPRHAQHERMGPVLRSKTDRTTITPCPSRPAPVDALPIRLPMCILRHPAPMKVSSASTVPAVLLKPPFLHREANPVEHKPSSFLGNTKRPVKLPGGDTILCSSTRSIQTAGSRYSGQPGNPQRLCRSSARRSDGHARCSTSTLAGLARYVTFSAPQHGHFTLPSDQRSSIINSRQWSKSAKQMIGVERESGVVAHEPSIGLPERRARAPVADRASVRSRESEPELVDDRRAENMCVADDAVPRVLQLRAAAAECAGEDAWVRLKRVAERKPCE